MRIHRTTDSPFWFGIRALFGLVTFSAVAMWWGAVGVLIVLAGTVIQYCILASLAMHLARTNRIDLQQPFQRWRLGPHRDGNMTWMCTTLYVILLYVLHLQLMMMWLPAGYQLIWHTPIFGLLTLSQIEHLSLVAFSALLVTSFLSGVYAGDRFSRRICIETSALLTVLHATHFAIP